MSIIHGKTNNFNNKLLISNTKLNIGAVNAINTSKPKQEQIVINQACNTTNRSPCS